MNLIFNHNRVKIATIAAILTHCAAYALMLNNQSTPNLTPNLFSHNIAISLSDHVITEKKIEKQVKSKPIVKDSINPIIQKEVKPQAIAKNETKQNDILVTSEFKLNGRRVAPHYPRRALRLKQEGVVFVRVLVSEIGETEQIIFAKKSEYSLLNKAALDAVKQWEFQPSIINGVATKTWIEIPVEFKIQS